MAIQVFDAYATQRIERQYASPAIVEQRRCTLEALRPRAAETILDIGCGPGFLVAEMAPRVGPSGRIIAIDTSVPMLEAARKRCGDLAWVEIRSADALNLPLPDASIDAVTAVQICLLVHAPERLIAEIARVLRPGGRTVIVDTDWDSLVWNSSDAHRMQRLISIWTSRYADPHIPRRLPGMLRDAGLALEHAAAIPIVELAPSADSYSGVQVQELPGHVAGKDGVTQAQAQAWLADQLALAAQGRYFYSLNRYLFAARKAR